MTKQAGRNGRLDFFGVERSVVFTDELFEPGVDKVADLTEGDGLATTGEGGGIGETVVDALAGAGEDGAGFASVVAHGDDVVELLAGEVVDGL